MRDQQRRLVFLVVSILGLARSGGVPHPHPHPHPLPHPHAHQQPHPVHHPFPHPHHCPDYGGCRQNRPMPFLPAQPGDTPDCAKDGSTFCETIEAYPQHLIQYLAERLSYDYNTLLSDESREEFKAKKEEPTTGRPAPPVYHPPYGPPHQQNYVHYTYGPPPPQPPRNPFSAPFPQPVYNSINYSQPQVGGYPDRRYPLFPQTYIPDNDPGLVYSALLQPELVAQYNSNSWWKRYSRSEGSKGSDDKLRQRRQSTGGGAGGNSTTTQLCPTRSQFVMPKAALNNKGNWMYVVNLDQDRYTQLVRSETCVSNQCNGICSLPNGYTSRCEQQYVQKRLVALEGGGNRLYTDVFWFPHCCICQITQNG